MSSIKDRRIITYGLSANADVRATTSELQMVQCFLMSISLSASTEIATPCLIYASNAWASQCQNCLAAIGIALEMNIDAARIKRPSLALAEFKAVGLRPGTSNGGIIIDDYGHHPVEITAALKAGRMLRQYVSSRCSTPSLSRLADLFTDSVAASMKQMKCWLQMSMRLVRPY